MKKELIFLAGFAVAAMSACTKDYEVLNTSSESLISFQPLATVQTKADPITEYVEGTGDFRVYAWYQNTTESGTFDPSKKFTNYMTNVLCQFEEGNKDTGDGFNTWMPESTYYWPKNGRLTFSAYYPASASKEIHVDPVTGITATGYKVENAAEQVDLMYSNRVFDRVSTTETDKNKNYDGVDIVFNHALAAADFKVKTPDKSNYAADAIKLYNIDIVDALSTGDFKEGYTTGKKEDAPVAKWACNDNSKKDYSVFNYNEKGSILPTATASQAGSTCILLPQEFSSSIKVVVTYGIKFKDASTDKWLTQTAEFYLKGTTDTSNDEITGWEMGKWYHYTITFTLDEVYFAPSVTDWDDVHVNPFEV